jgi:glycosyltransferase involved in cell wall biosynthesis
LSRRLNQGAALARGEILVRMDADDAMHPLRLERQTAVLMDAGPDVVTGTWSYSMDSRGEVIGQRRPPNRRHTGFSARDSFLHPSVAAFTSWFRANPYTIKPIYHRSEDSELWCRTAARTTFVQIPEHLLFYREGDWFSFDNHLASMAGNLSLAKAHAPDRNHFLFYLTRELAKLWLVGIAHSFRKDSWITRSRFSGIGADDKQSAQQALEQLALIETGVNHAVA